MMQVMAILKDSLRYLRSRYLFWATLIISALASVVLFGTYSFNEEGMRFLWFKTIPHDSLTSDSDSARMFVAYIFSGIFINYWLAWGAIILAIVSTSSLLPDFLQSGAIDLSLSKPITRSKLFVLRAVGGLLFVVVQVTVSVLLAYVLIGLRFDMWMHASLLAIPLITLQFAYLYAFATLIAAFTRSTLACLLGTIIIWFAASIVQFAANQIEEQRANAELMHQRAATRAELAQQFIDEHEDPSDRLIQRLEAAKEREEETLKPLEWLTTWSSRFETVELFVPKTGDVQKLLATEVEAPVLNEFVSLFVDFDDEQFRPAGIDEEEWRDIQAAETEGQRAGRQVDAWRSIGSSVAISLGCVLLATWWFSRRDF